MMYVLARSNLSNLQLDVEYMMELMDPSLALGEGPQAHTFIKYTANSYTLLTLHYLNMCADCFHVKDHTIWPPPMEPWNTLSLLTNIGQLHGNLAEKSRIPSTAGKDVVHSTRSGWHKPLFGYTHTQKHRDFHKDFQCTELKRNPEECYFEVEVHSLCLLCRTSWLFAVLRWEVIQKH